MTESIQALMDQAYARFDRGMSLEQFWDQLNADERVAVFVGNLNYQVENGGFMQWMDNGYATDEVVGFLTRLFNNRIGTEATREVAELIKQAYRFADEIRNYDFDEADRELDKLDRKFYELNAEMLADVERFLVEEMATSVAFD
jgi:hypothetical protein